jgi:hypothetical protein
MTPPYTVDYFIQKFEAIPEEMWTTRGFVDGESKCALGHCGQTCATEPFTAEAGSLTDLFMNQIGSVARVNDGHISRYYQPTPKARILAALRDIQKKQEKA